MLQSWFYIRFPNLNVYWRHTNTNYEKNFLSSLLLIFSILNLSTVSFSQILPDSIPLKVVLIQQGEKPKSGFNLSCKGYNRSRMLPRVITSLFGVPDYVYVPTIMIGRTTNAARMYQTVIPLAVKYGLLVNTKYQETDSIE